MKNIEIVCTSTTINPNERKLGVESYGAKDNSLEVENGILEINAYSAMPEMDIPALTEKGMAIITENARRRVTEGAISRRTARNIQREVR